MEIILIICFIIVVIYSTFLKTSENLNYERNVENQKKLALQIKIQEEQKKIKEEQKLNKIFMDIKMATRNEKCAQFIKWLRDDAFDFYESQAILRNTSHLRGDNFYLNSKKERVNNKIKELCKYKNLALISFEIALSSDDETMQKVALEGFSILNSVNSITPLLRHYESRNSRWNTGEILIRLACSAPIHGENSFVNVFLAFLRHKDGYRLTSLLKNTKDDILKFSNKEFEDLIKFSMNISEELILSDDIEKRHEGEDLKDEILLISGARKEKQAFFEQNKQIKSKE